MAWCKSSTDKEFISTAGLRSDINPCLNRNNEGEEIQFEQERSGADPPQP